MEIAPQRKNLSVFFAFRSFGEYRSIEELFNTVTHQLSQYVHCESGTVPKAGASAGAMFANVLWAARNSHCDIFHITGDVHYAILGALWARKVLTIHDLRFIDDARGAKRFILWFLWIALPCLFADRITVISEFTKTRLLASGFINPQKVRVISNCVGQEFGPRYRDWPSGVVRVLQIGTTDNKNIPRVIEACSNLPICLVILGRLSPTQTDLLIASKIKYELHDSLSRHEVVELYSSVDLICAASIYEGFGMPIIEGNTIGRPVLTSNLAPMSEISADAAVQVDPFDVDSIRSGFVRLIEDRDLRDVLVRKGYENAKKYSRERIASEYLSVYSEIINK